MAWWRKDATRDENRDDLSEARLREQSGTLSLSLEARLEVVEDGRVVYSRPIFPTPTVPGPHEPLRDMRPDLDTGRQLGAGGFVALDFETATSLRNSACAVGVAAVEGGHVTDIGRWLIRPPGNSYEGFNEAIHGITSDMTSDSPSMREVWPEVLAWVRGRPLVAHYAPFDLSVLRHSLTADGAEWPDLTYYCTCALARRAWPGRLSYRLPDLAAECALSLKHHEPGADAAASGELGVACCGRANAKSLEEACRTFGMVPGRLTATSWGANGMMPTRLSDLEPTVDVVPENSPFENRTVVFTGTLTCGWTRKDAAQQVVNAGGKVAGGISKKVDYLVLGMQDAFKVKDGEHSSKMLRAAELRATGYPIELLAEDDFLRMLPQ